MRCTGPWNASLGTQMKTAYMASASEARVSHGSTASTAPKTPPAGRAVLIGNAALSFRHSIFEHQPANNQEHQIERSEQVDPMHDRRPGIAAQQRGRGLNA